MQWSKAGATLGDYKEFIRTWGQAVNSMGFTDKQVGMQLDTISRRLGTLKADLMSMNVSAGQNGLATVIKDTITFVDRFVVGLKQIPAWSIEAAVGLGVAAKAFGVLKGAIVATNVASMASRATPLGLALTALGVAAGFAVEHLGALSNAERDAATQTSDNIAIAQQQEQQMEKQVEFSDALIAAHQKLQTQIDSSTEGTEIHTKALENQQETEKQLTSILGQAAVDRMRDADWSAESYDKEKQAFVDGVNKKKEALQIMLENQITALTNQKEILETQINNYWADVDAFKQSIFAKADALSWWQKIQASYYGHEKEFHQEQANITEQEMAGLEEGNPIYNMLAATRDADLQAASEYEAKQQAVFDEGAQEFEDKKAKITQEIEEKKLQQLKLLTAPPVDPLADVGSTKKGKGPSSMPTDQSEAIQKKLENYAVKSIEDQAAIAQDAYKSRLDAITDATNRYGKSYAFLDQTIGAMNKHVEELKGTSNALTAQLTASMDKVNALASETGATLEILGGVNTSNAEGSTWYRETSDVNIEGLKSQAISAISAVSQKFYELTGQQMVVSSGYRDWGGHTDATKFDVVDSASSTLLEQNANGIRDAIISYAQGLGLQVIDEYAHPSEHATAGHLDFEAAGFTPPEPVSVGTETEQIINQMAAKYSVDARLAQAIAQVESGKDQSVTSSAGAIGVMQLMPDTAASLGVNPYDLQGNIEGGVKYISEMLQAFNGNLELAIAAYNAGPQAVKDAGGIPNYQETQDYVRKVLNEYTNQSAVASAPQQISITGLSDTLAGAGVSQESWKGMSAESKRQFIEDHKEQISNANILIGYLNMMSGIEKKRAEIEKEIAKTVKDEYTARIKGIKEVEEYQQKLADQAKRSHMSTLGYYATDTDKAIAEQVANQQKLAASNAALEYAKKHGINIFTDQTMSEERVKNLELQAQVEQQSTFGTPEARYKQRLAEIEYQQKLSQAQIEGDQTSPMNTQAKLLSNIDAAKEKVKALTDLLKEMQAKDPFANQTEQFKKYNLELKEAQKNAKELAETYTTKMRQGVYDVTNELLLQGKKISDIWGDLWKQLANDALKALMRIHNDSPGILAQALGIFGGAKSAQQKQKANSWSDYANVIGVTANTWGTGSSYKTPTKAAETLDTSKWNALAKMTSAFPSAAERGASGVYSGNYNTKNTAAAAPKQSGGIAWGSLLGSLAGLFHAKGGVVDTPSIAGEDGEEVIIPTQKNTQNSKSLLGYAAGKLGVSSGGLTADFSSKDIAKTAMNISVSSATNMAKTNAILATQNQILTTMLNNMGQQQGQTNVIIGGSGDTSMESQASAYSTLVARRYITK